MKQFWRFTRTWICHNHKLYYTYVLLCAIGLYNVWYQCIIGHYIRNNYERSLEYAIKKEKEYVPPPEDDDEYGEEDYGAEAPAEGAEDAAEEE